MVILSIRIMPFGHIEDNQWFSWKDIITSVGLKLGESNKLLIFGPFLKRDTFFTDRLFHWQNVACVQNCYDTQNQALTQSVHILFSLHNYEFHETKICESFASTPLLCQMPFITAKSLILTIQFKVVLKKIQQIQYCNKNSSSQEKNTYSIWT